jgi:hypothetical protein
MHVRSVRGNKRLLFEFRYSTIIPGIDDSDRRSKEAMIPANRLEELKKLFAEDGITLTNAEALEIGLWLLARIRPVLQVVPLDKAAQFWRIKRATKAMRCKTPFIKLSEWRRARHKKQNPPQPKDVSS